MGKLSIILPLYNEKENIIPLYKEIKNLEKYLDICEVIFVNDGSDDGTEQILAQMENKDKKVKVLKFARNFGQTAAFDAGIKNAKGELIATLDGDGQNNPADLVSLVAKLNRGFDLVVGWRKKRQDNLEKRFFSYLANKFRCLLTGESIHDSGCSLRVGKREVFDNLDLYGEMHRFIPAILTLKGYKIGEIEVGHRKRFAGQSKYGLSRIFKGFFDLLFIVFLMRFSARPIHFFGGLGMMTLLLGVTIATYLSFIKFFWGSSLANRPLLILAVLLIILGIQFFIFGILAEILMRIYYKTHKIRPWTIR